MNPLRPKHQPPPLATGDGTAQLLEAELGLSDTDRLLLARAVQYTRVSYFTPTERQRLAELLPRVTGYHIKGGL